MAESRGTGPATDTTAKATENSNFTYAKRRAFKWANRFSDEKRAVLAAIIWPGTDDADQRDAT
jgi:hypothetical protein